MAKTTRADNIRPGPSVARWRCPSCREDVPRLLPNGQLNRVTLEPSRLQLEHPEIDAALARERGFRAQEICYACDQAYRELLGTLVRPPMEEGDARGAPGLLDTGLIGALIPSMQKGTLVLIFYAIDGRLQHTETERLLEFNPDRLTYPASRGAIAPLIWSLYEAHLATLHAAIENENHT
ncbi:MAG: hypothetical protein ACK4IT_03470 [Thioalkalivibrionaceae bacterium]